MPPLIILLVYSKDSWSIKTKVLKFKDKEKTRLDAYVDDKKAKLIEAEHAVLNITMIGG